MHDDLRSRIDAASAQHERARKALLRSDGEPRYAPAEFEEREQAARREFHTALNRVSDEIELRIASAEERLLRLEHADPSSQLDQAELAQAGARSEFVRAEVSNHTAAGLAERVKALISSGDRPALFLYAVYLRAKASEAGEGAVIPEPEQLALKELAAKLERALDPGLAGRIEAAKEEIAQLEKLKTFVYARRHGARDLVELHLAQQYGGAASGR